MLNRAASRIYDEQLRPLGIRFSQMNILTVVALAEPVQPGEVARKLSMEKSTLSRNVRALEASGWLESRPGASGNTRELRLTHAGRNLLEAAAPAWRDAQATVTSALGASTSSAIRTAVNRLGTAEGG